MAKPPPRDSDDYMRQYLAETDLSALDLGHIDLQSDQKAERNWQWMRAGLGTGVAAALLWVMNTDFYLFHGHGTVLVPIVWLSLVATVAFIGLVMFGLSQGAPRPVFSRFRGRRLEPKALPPHASFRLVLSDQWQRYLLLGTGLSLGAAVLFYLPQEAEWQGTGYTMQWFMAVGAALMAGITLGRWLIAQAAHAQSRAQLRGPAPPFVWPPWFKWVTLSLLVCAGLFATFGHAMLGTSDGATVSFELSGLGLVVGISAAIWIARRFDEWEADFKKEAARNRDKS